MNGKNIIWNEKIVPMRAQSEPHISKSSMKPLLQNDKTRKRVFKRKTCRRIATDTPCTVALRINSNEVSL